VLSVANRKFKQSEHDVERTIKGIMAVINSPEHADDIIELRRVLRRNVPFFFRSYFAAYLLKDLLETGRKGPSRQGPQPQRDLGPRQEGRKDQGATPRDGRQDRQQPKPKDARREERQPRPDRAAAERQPQERIDSQKQERHPPLPEGVETATLFVSAGRKRHFYPRHLLEIFEEAGIPGDAVGEIRLFDNYTFVEVRSERAEEAISRMDGVAFKGRKLTVNRARKKDEEDPAREKPRRRDDEFAPRPETEPEADLGDEDDSFADDPASRDARWNDEGAALADQDTLDEGLDGEADEGPDPGDEAGPAFEDPPADRADPDPETT
jgi:hypothetical protein